MSIPRDVYIGPPDHPAPWTTDRPLEGLRDTDEARIVSLAPDVCQTPMGGSMVPVPYPITSVAGDDANYTETVRFTGQRAMVLRSHTTRVTGDEAGTGGGMVSGTVGDICEPIGHAAQVRAEGSCVIRHLDRFHMNNRNTVGEAVYVCDTTTYAPLTDDDPLPGSQLLVDADSAPPKGSFQGAVAGGDPRIFLAQAPAPAHTPGHGPALPPGPPGQVIYLDDWRPTRPPPQPNPPPDSWLVRNLRWGALPLTLFLSGSTPLIPSPGRDADDIERELNRQARDLLDPFDHSHNQRVQEWYFEQLQDYRELRQRLADNPELVPPPDGPLDADDEEQPPAVPADQAQQTDDDTDADEQSDRENVRVDALPYINPDTEDGERQCIVGPYWAINGLCGAGSQAHHIVPDYAVRYGTREEGVAGINRIPNMPSFWNGAAICLQGQAEVPGTEHNRAQRAADRAIRGLGATGTPPNTALISDIRQSGEQAAISVRPGCSSYIEEETRRAFEDAGTRADQLGRTRRGPPVPARLEVDHPLRVALERGMTQQEFHEWRASQP